MNTRVDMHTSYFMSRDYLLESRMTRIPHHVITLSHACQHFLKVRSLPSRHLVSMYILGVQARVKIQWPRIRADHKVLSADAHFYAFFAFIAFIAFIAFLGAGAAAAAFFLLFAIVRSAGEWGKGSLKITFLESYKANNLYMTMQKLLRWQLFQNQTVCVSPSVRGTKLATCWTHHGPWKAWTHDEKKLRSLS